MSGMAGALAAILGNRRNAPQEARASAYDLGYHRGVSEARELFGEALRSLEEAFQNLLDARRTERESAGTTDMSLEGATVRVFAKERDFREPREWAVYITVKEPKL